MSILVIVMIIIGISCVFLHSSTILVGTLSQKKMSDLMKFYFFYTVYFLRFLSKDDGSDAIKMMNNYLTGCIFIYS
jgi:hypothetical protein